MRVSKLAVTAVAVAAAAGLAAGTANAAARPAPATAAKTTLTIAEHEAKLAGADIISGKLTEGTAALAKEKVELWAVTGTKAAEVASAVTGRGRPACRRSCRCAAPGPGRRRGGVPVAVAAASAPAAAFPARVRLRRAG